MINDGTQDSGFPTCLASHARLAWNRNGGDNLKADIEKIQNLHFAQQHEDGYWWYTLEANEAIGAELIQVMHFLGCVDEKVQAGLLNRMIIEQREDGSWPLYYGDEGDLHITIECYFVLKLNGHDINADYMRRAREFILKQGGLTKSRVFTRIHLAMFGLLPWSSCPAMPIEFLLLKPWMPVNIYEFSSWARACIIPLLVIMNKKPVKKLKDNFNLEELFLESQEERDFQFSHDKSLISWENFFIKLDKFLKVLERVPFKPQKTKEMSIKAAEEWIVAHIERTEDIYPAMAYAAVAMNVIGHPVSYPTIQKCLSGLASFQQRYEGELPAVSFAQKQESCVSNGDTCIRRDGTYVHQQCCVSPVWDTPWSITALLDSGVSEDDPRLLRAGRWLISKEITEGVGDWKIKNPHGVGGGWSFEFQNDYFPDIDDTIQVIHVLKRLAIPDEEKDGPINRGLGWILSMQNNDGGWAAFDKNNNLELVNKIPFSDHGACLDPSSPDITARVIALLGQVGFSREEESVKKALDYLYSKQKSFGGWFGRWGINYIYGTWAVLTGLRAIGEDMGSPAVKRAVLWLESIQNSDGGFSESPKSYDLHEYVPCPESVPSQTAWAIMGLMAVKIDTCSNRNYEKEIGSIMKGIQYLTTNLQRNGSWNEKYFTGTGFPGHFYIRYHGYRHYFPLMALGTFHRLITH